VHGELGFVGLVFLWPGCFSGLQGLAVSLLICQQQLMARLAQSMMQG
jgi:hypothetical protein